MIKSSFVQNRTDHLQNHMSEFNDLRVMLKECHFEIVRDALKEHCVNDLTWCWVVYMQCDVVSDPYSTTRWFLHSNELRFLSHLWRMVDHYYLHTQLFRLRCSTMKSKNKYLHHIFDFETVVLIENIVVKQIISVISLNLNKDHEHKIRWISIHLWVMKWHRMNGRVFYASATLNKAIFLINWNTRKICCLLGTLIVSIFDHLNLSTLTFKRIS